MSSSCPVFYTQHFRRVHISEALLNQLNGEFEVELGNGKLRDEFLRENDIETYFIADSEVVFCDVCFS